MCVCVVLCHAFHAVALPGWYLSTTGNGYESAPCQPGTNTAAANNATSCTLVATPNPVHASNSTSDDAVSTSLLPCFWSLCEPVMRTLLGSAEMNHSSGYLSYIRWVQRFNTSLTAFAPNLTSFKMDQSVALLNSMFNSSTNTTEFCSDMPSDVAAWLAYRTNGLTYRGSSCMSGYFTTTEDTLARDIHLSVNWTGSISQPNGASVAVKLTAQVDSIMLQQVRQARYILWKSALMLLQPVPAGTGPPAAAAVPLPFKLAVLDDGQCQVSGLRLSLLGHSAMMYVQVVPVSEGAFVDVWAQIESAHNSTKTTRLTENDFEGLVPGSWFRATAKFIIARSILESSRTQFDGLLDVTMHA